jgi:ketosteroid isomerase-like protein
LVTALKKELLARVNGYDAKATENNIAGREMVVWEDIMGVAENKETVKALLEAMRKGKIETCRNIVTDDMVTRIPQSCEKVLNNPIIVRGADECLKGKASIRGDAFASDMKLKIKALLGDGDDVAALLEISTIAFKGEPYANDYVFLFRFRGDKIAECDAYMDTAHVYQQFGFNISKV